MEAVTRARGQDGKIEEPAWGVVGQHILYFEAVGLYVGVAKGVFLVRGHLPGPPVDAGVPLFLVGALAAPKAEEAHPLQLQDAAPADVVDVAAHRLHPPAELFLHRQSVQHLVVFVGAVQEQDGVGALGQPVQALALLFAAVPQKAEVPQHEKDVVFAQAAQLFALEAVQLPVGIPSDIDHACLPLLVCESDVPNPCHPPANLLYY